MRRCRTCRHKKRMVFFDKSRNYDYCALRNEWPISHSVLRALTCPAYENVYKLVEGWRELHDGEVDE